MTRDGLVCVQAALRLVGAVQGHAQTLAAVESIVCSILYAWHEYVLHVREPIAYTILYVW